MNANYFSYCWIHSHDFELWSFTQICLFPLLLLSCQTYFLQPFFSASPPMFFSHGLLTVQSVPGTWNVKSTGKRFMPIFCLPSKGRISLRILKVAFAFVASCLWKKKHDVELFSLPEIYSLYHPPPPNPDAPPLKWSTTELSIIFPLLQAPILLNGSHVSCPFLFSLLEFRADITETSSWQWKEEKYWEDSDRRKLIDGDFLYCHWEKDTAQGIGCF